MAEINGWGDTLISVQVPAHLYAGSVEVTVTANSLTSNNVDFTVTGGPPFRDLGEECEEEDEEKGGGDGDGGEGDGDGNGSDP
jgi:hypothetical protein